MKKAFTVMELMFIIIVIGILAAVVMPRMERDVVREAAIQLVSHIRYTQHLALVDDRYNKDDADWYRSRWQIIFENNADSGGEESYTIFSDNPDYSGHAGANEIATNPQDKSKKLTGGTNGVSYDNAAATRSMNLGIKYGIVDVNLTDSCKFSSSKRIAFDHLGRPLKGDLSNATTYMSPYPNSNRIITSNCDITLSDGTESVTIRITPETGYTYILN
ncbi:pilus assembly FimT family protein [Sulfurimonas marina]|uniref:Type II/IV secretion system protein n=1 Tax=Sulfurimonas marina TaxID=2590551 RepID=A0A7M1AW29_9BACT|nr:type II/IV secretion system protein [Sulfurimonas marina]QOP40798.1 type II/IV secretion system protein [Sulfurimonas marina]